MALQLTHMCIVIVSCQLEAVELEIPLCGLLFDFAVPAVSRPALVPVDAHVLLNHRVFTPIQNWFMPHGNHQWASAAGNYADICA